MMEKVYRAYRLDANNKVGVVIPESVMRKIEVAIHRILSEHQRECVAYNWTLNGSWKEDGEQVVINYPCRIFRPKEDRIDDVIGAESLMMYPCLFTECDNVDEVAKMCSAVARGELTADATWERGA